MLTIQLPSDMPTGPPPTILVLLWTKHPTDDSSPGRVHIQILLYNPEDVVYVSFTARDTVINGDIAHKVTFSRGT